MNPKSWSFVTWLIVINIAVFAIDGVMSRFVTFPTIAQRAVPLPGVAEQGYTPGKMLVARPKNGGVIPPGASQRAPVMTREDDKIQYGETSLTYRPPLQAVGIFSTYTAFKNLEIWRFLTFQFLHANLSHILFNMLALFFFGPPVEQYLGSRKKFAAFYLTCGIMGAFTYLLLNLIDASIGTNILGGGSIYAGLVGASAGCYGVLMACAKVRGKDTMYVMGVIPMTVRTGAFVMLGISAFALISGSDNPGGNAAHVGGAIAGWFFIRRMHLLDDFFDIFGPKHQSAINRKKRNAVKATKATKQRTQRKPRVTKADQKRVDDILARAKSKGGIANLSDDDQAFLAEMTKRMQELDNK